MGLDKPQLDAKFIVAGFIYYGNIREFVLNSLFEPPFGGVRGNVRTSSIARWKAHSRLHIRGN